MKNISAKTLQLAMLAFTMTTLGHLAYARESSFLAKNGLENKTTTQMVEYIDQLKQDRPLLFSASITSTELKVSDGQEAHSYPLGDKFYLAFAPYITHTHPCFNHNLSSCTGELKNTAFKVKIIDQSGNVIVSNNMTSYQNGFIGVWLPRNITGTINVTYNGLTAVTPFATGAKNQTCLTNVKLEKPI